MRLTVSINDALHRQAQHQARERGLTLGQYVAEVIRQDLVGVQEDPRRPVVPVFEGGTGLRAGVDLESNRALCEFLDEGVAFEKLR